VPIRRGEPWARLCAPLLLFIFYGPTLLATLSVEAATPASPPWWGNLTALTVTAIAFILDWPLGGDMAG
jgi:hypothetical protein